MQSQYEALRAYLVEEELQPTSPAASVIPQARSASCVISSATILKNALLSSVCHNADPNPLPPAIASVIWRVAKQQPVSLHLDAHIPPGKGPFPASDFRPRRRVDTRQQNRKFRRAAF